MLQRIYLRNLSRQSNIMQRDITRETNEIIDVDIRSILHIYETACIVVGVRFAGGSRVCRAMTVP